MKPLLAACCAALIACAGLPAQAQHIVHDPTAYAQMIREAKTALDQLKALRDQLEQGERLLESLNTVSGVNAVAESLTAPSVRNPLPDASAFAAAARGDLDALGALAARANQIRDQHRAYTPTGEASTPAEAWYRQTLAQAGDRAARDYAAAEAVASAAEQRVTGLDDLRRALDTAPNARAVLDLTARIAAEQAQLQNEQTRFKGLEMMAEAEDRLVQQQARERAEAAHAARLQLYQATFQ